MFGKRRSSDLNIYDTRMKAYSHELTDAKWNIHSLVQAAYCKKQALDVWEEDTADYRTTLEELKTARRRVQCAVGHYDAVQAEMRNYYGENHDKFSVYHRQASDYPSSHDVIDFAIRDLFRK